MIGYGKKKKKSKHLSYRLAFKLHCFHFVTGYPAFNSLAKSVRLGFWIYFYPIHSLPWVQNKVAGFLPELLAPIHTQPWSGRVGGVESAFPWLGVGKVLWREIQEGSFRGRWQQTVGRLDFQQAECQCRVSLRKQQLPRTGQGAWAGRCLWDRAGQGHAQPGTDS